MGGGGGLCNITPSALLVLNALLNNVSALIRLLGWGNFPMNQKDISASCYTHSLRFLTWVNQQARTCPSFQITQAHTHVCTYTKSTHKMEYLCHLPVSCTWPYRWPIRVNIGSFHTIYMNIKHPCMGNTEPKFKTFLNVFRNTPPPPPPQKIKIKIGLFPLCITFICTPCAIRD